MTLTLAALLLAGLAGCLDNDAPEADVEGEPPFQAADALAYTPRDGLTASTPVTTGARASWIDTGFAGSEPNMGITSAGNLYLSAYSDVLRSTDDGETFEVVHTHDPLPNNDPMLWVDPITDTIYNAPMFPILLCSSVYRSQDEGVSWSQVPSPICGKGPFDHQKIASGLPGPDALPPAGVVSETVTYMCYNTVPTTNCAVSWDNGLTWIYDRPVFTNVVENAVGTDVLPTNSDCGSGQNGHPTISGAGVVALPKTAPGCSSGPLVGISFDSGLTWEVRDGPDDTSLSTDAEIAFTEDETMFYFYQDETHRKKLARSSDYGLTWDAVWDVTPPGVTSTIFEAMHAGDDGRLAFAFLGSANYEGNPSDAPLETTWNLYIVTTDTADADLPQFVVYQVTSDDDPVQRGCALIGGGSNPCRNMLDFIDGAVHPDGSFYVVYTEGCYEDCPTATIAELEAGGVAGFRGRHTAMAKLDGFSLYATDA